MNLRNFKGRVLLIFFGVTIALLTLEGILRMLPQRLQIWQPHPLFGWFNIPKAEGWWFKQEFAVQIKINSLGLRDLERSHSKAEGVFRILLLGDSFTEAYQVPLEDTYAQVIERELNLLALGKRIEVINGGVASWGTDNELLFFRHEGYKYKPDLVLLVFDVSNDVLENYHPFWLRWYDNRKKPFFIINDEGKLELYDFPIAISKVGTQGDKSKKCGYLGFVKSIARHSHLYTFVGDTIQTRFPWIDSKLRKFGLITIPDKSSQRDLGGEVPLEYFVYTSVADSDWEAAWRLTESLVSQLRMEVQQAGSKFGVVIIGFEEVVNQGRWLQVLQTYPRMQQYSWDVQSPEHRVIEFLRPQGIPYDNLLPSFRQHYEQNQSPLYFRSGDSHWNAEGQRMAGKLIFKWLIANNFVPISESKP